MAEMRRRTTRAQWLAGAFAALVVALLAAACGSEQDSGGVLDIGGQLSNLDATTVCVDGREGCPCSTPGQTAACGKVVQEYENYTTCAEGQSTCTNGAWGPCSTGSTVVAKSTRAVTIAEPRGAVTATPRVAQVVNSCADGGLTAASVCDPNSNCTLTIDGPTDVADASGLSFTESGITIPGTIEYEGGGTGDGNTSCTLLQCQVHYCAGNPNGTTITGTVYDPAGVNPLYNAWVYIPLNATAALPTFTAGAQCSTCAGAASLNAVAVAQTAPNGTFTLTNVPDGTNIPIVVQMGKWRREIILPSVTQCANNVLSPGTLRLPKNLTDGVSASMPQIAFVSGSADPFECMLLKAGIDPLMFGSSSTNSSRPIHYYNSPDSAGASIDPSYGSVVSASKMWLNNNSPWNLSAYDVVILACEGAEYNNSDRNPTGYNDLVAYANAGGRVFLSHYSYVWLKYNSTTAWSGVTPGWGPSSVVSTQDPMYGTIVTSGFPKGQAFQQWLGDIGDLVAADGGALPPSDGGVSDAGADAGADAGPTGVLTIHQGRQDTTTPLSSIAQPWMTATDTANDALNPATYDPSFTFNTPTTAAAASQCGRVVFSDFHVATSAQVSTSFGGSVSCATNADCGYGSTCPSGASFGTCTAQSCTSSSQCGDSNWSCENVTQSCSRNSCFSNGNCASDHCVGGVCGCAQASDCGTGGVCNTSSHTCTTIPSTCTSSSTCSTGNGTCVTNAGTCVANSCTSTAGCSATTYGGQERCVGSPATCNGCETSDDCPGAQSLCSGATLESCVNSSNTTVNGDNFPYECIQAPLTPQEAALEFEFFDLSACVSPNGIVPQGPPAPITVYNPVTFTVNYTSSCPSGTHVAWRTLTWQATIPATASIVFSAQTVNPPDDGGPPIFTGAQSVTLATATSADPSSSASIDIVSTDGGPAGAFEMASPPVTSGGDLLLTITLNPTSNQQTPPTLTAWQVTSDCPSSE